VPRPRAERAFPPALKRFGQHFLTDHTVLERIADALAPTSNDRVVEIGPGRGALTEVLRPKVGELVLVELDRALAQMQREHYADDPHVTVVERDVLDVPLGEIGGDDFLLAGNVPYYITTPILFHTLAGVLPRRAVFLVQREVAERITAAPGTKEYGALTVNLHALARVENLFDVPPGAFRPPPKVYSAVVRMVPRASPLVTHDERAAFRGFVQALFSQRRKQLAKTVGKYAEDARVAIRNIRREANDKLKTMAKDKHVSQDDERRGHDTIQKTTDKFIAKVDELAKKKEQEVLAI